MNLHKHKKNILCLGCRFGRLCDPVVYGFHDLSTLLMAIPETIQLRGKGRLTIIKLNPLFKGKWLNNLETIEQIPHK